MTTPTGQISLSDVNTEFGLPWTTQINMNNDQVRFLANRPTGQISMSDLRGKTWITFTPEVGTELYDQQPAPGNAAFNLTCNVPVTWTYTGYFEPGITNYFSTNGYTGTAWSGAIGSAYFQPDFGWSAGGAQGIVTATHAATGNIYQWSFNLYVYNNMFPPNG